MAILLLFDGTGEADDEVYRRDFHDAFLRRIYRNYSNQRHYWRGPSLFGMECDETMFEAARRISDGANHDLIIAGYSRGGAIAIALCYHIQRRNLYPRPLEMMGTMRIPLLILFDAVNRSTELSISDTATIPNIVENCIHVRRDPVVESRWYFGNCGMDAEAGVNFITSTFFCTHAAMGGTPWTGDHPTRSRRIPDTSSWQRDFRTVYEPTITREQDVAGSLAVQRFVNQKIQALGFATDNLQI